MTAASLILKATKDMTGQFADRDGQIYRVTIGTETGELTFGADPVHIVWDRPEHLFVGVRTSSCRVRVVTGADLSWLYTDDPLGTAVTVETIAEVDSVETVTGCLFFGYLVPQEWDAPFSGLNDEIELMAVDALAALNNIRYTAANGRYPQSLTGQSILARGCQIADILTVPTLPSVIGTINEQAFLPRYEDVSEYNSERLTWGEVLDAIAVWEGVCLMQNPTDATELLAVDVIDEIENGTAEEKDVRGADSAGTDVRMSIEPAKSRVVVSYANLSQMPLMPELTTSRLDGNKLSETSVRGGNDTFLRTEARYFAAKDWASQGVRDGCGAIVNLIDTLHDMNEEKVCIVGPASLRNPYYNTREPFLDVNAIVIEFGAWARNDMNVNQDGYEELTINTQASNFDPTVNIFVDDPVLGSYSVNKTLDLDGKDGFTQCKVYLDKWFVTDPDAHFVGNIWMTIPAHCVITDLTATVWDRSNEIMSGRTALDEVENGGIVELKTAGWNDSVEIQARLRSVAVPYAAADIQARLIPPAWWDKFPYCKTEQFEAPRRRVQAKVEGLWPVLGLIEDVDLSGQRMVVDAADLDLRDGCSTVLLVDTWVGASLPSE